MPILKKWEIANWIWIIAAGSLLHFVYDLTGENPFVGVFVPVNESVWEHLKLLLLPVFLFSWWNTGSFPLMARDFGTPKLSVCWQECW